MKLRIACIIPFVACLSAEGGPPVRSPSEPSPSVSATEYQGDVRAPAPVAPRTEAIVIERPNLTVEEFFEEEGVPQRVLQAVDVDPESALFFTEANERFQFSPQEMTLMKTNGFAVRQSSYGRSFGGAYYDIYANDLPVLITSDSLLHALHSSYDHILKDIEKGYFSGTIQQVLGATQQHIIHVANNTSNPQDLANLKSADLYLTVGLSLLQGKLVPSGLGNDPQVVRILKTARHQGVVRIFLHGEYREVDFSQFKPRGHYTESQYLENYFKCMMWMGRADTGLVLSKTSQLRTAATLTLMLRDAGMLEALNRVSDIVRFMVGESDNLTPFRLAVLMEEMNIDQLADLANETTLKTLQQRLLEDHEGAQAILSQMQSSSPSSSEPVAPPPLFQVFGQREVLDSRIMQEVVYDRIVFEDEKQGRTMLSGLDVMAGLGNNEALHLLEPELQTWKYSGNLSATRDFVARQPGAFWESTLYNLWLDALRSLHAPLEGKHAPQFMKTQAWQRKQLNTQLASWSQLRRDTILYSKQTYGLSIGCVYPKGAVEPYPEFYGKLAHFARHAQDLFEGADQQLLIVPRVMNYFAKMEDIMNRLQSLANKQLAAKPFSKSDDEWIDNLIQRQDRSYSGPDWSGWYLDLYYDKTEALKWEPTIADVYTGPGETPNDPPMALHVGVGHLHTLFAVMDNDGDHTLHVGPTMSYHEFKRPLNQRLNDQTWQNMIGAGHAPDSPKWTKSYQAERDQKESARLQDIHTEHRRIKKVVNFMNRLLDVRKSESTVPAVATGTVSKPHLEWLERFLLNGARTKADVLQTLKELSPDLQACQATHPTYNDAGLKKWIVRFHIDSSGRVNQVRTQVSELNHPQLEDCFLRRLNDHAFRAIEDAKDQTEVIVSLLVSDGS